MEAVKRYRAKEEGSDRSAEVGVRVPTFLRQGECPCVAPPLVTVLEWEWENRQAILFGVATTMVEVSEVTEIDRPAGVAVEHWRKFAKVLEGVQGGW